MEPSRSKIQKILTFLPKKVLYFSKHPKKSLTFQGGNYSSLKNKKIYIFRNETFYLET